MKVLRFSALVSNIKKFFADKAHVRAGLLLLLCIGVAVTVLFVTRPELAAGDLTISKRAYKEYIRQASEGGVAEATARSALYESLVSRAAVKKTGFDGAPTDAELVTAAARKYTLKDGAKPNAYQAYTAYPSAVAPKLRLADAGGYQLAIINYPFSRYITGFPGTTFGDPNLKGNISAINDDREYAKKNAEATQAALNTGATTTAQAVEKARNDQRLVYGQASNQSRLVSISNNGGEESIYDTDYIRPINFARIQRTAEQPGKAVIEEDLFDATPGDYGLSIPDLLRDDGTRMQVGYTVLVVERSIKQTKGLLDSYTKYVGELTK